MTVFGVFQVRFLSLGLLTAYLHLLFLSGCTGQKANDKGLTTIKSIGQNGNSIVCMLRGGSGNKTSLASLVQTIIVKNTLSGLAFEGDSIYPCESQSGPFHLILVSKDQNRFKDTNVSVPFSWKGIFQNEKAKCGPAEFILVAEGIERVSGDLIACPQPSDIEVIPEYKNCTFSVILKEPFRTLSYDVLLEGEKVPSSGVSLKSIEKWNLAVRLMSGGCRGEELPYYLNGDLISQGPCIPLELRQAKVKEIRSLLTLWLKNPSNRAEMDKCQHGLTSFFGDKGFEVMLDNNSLGSFSALREHIDMNTLSNPGISYKLVDFELAVDPLLLKSIKVARVVR